MLAMAFAILAGLSGAVARGAGDSEADHSRRITNMSSAERLELQRKYDEFRTLPEADKNRYRQLHQALQKDAASGGELTAISRGYGEWLKTLNVKQREELRNMTTPEQRRTLVKKILDDQKERQQKLLDSEPLPGPLQRLPRLTPPELAKSMDIFAKQLRDHDIIPSKAEKELKELQGTARYLRLFELLAEYRRPDPVVNKGKDFYPTTEEKKALVLSIQSADTRQFLEKSTRENWAPPMTMYYLLGVNVLRQYNQEIFADDSMATRDRLFQKLLPEQQQYLLNSTPSRHHEILVRTSLENARRIVFMSLFRPGDIPGFTPPPGNGRPGGAGGGWPWQRGAFGPNGPNKPGDRPPPENNEERKRRPEFRGSRTEG